jgi:hypothetical protein
MLGTKQWLGPGIDSAAGIGQDHRVVDPACSLITRNEKPPYSKVEIFAALEQVFQCPTS